MEKIQKIFINKALLLLLTFAFAIVNAQTLTTPQSPPVVPGGDGLGGVGPGGRPPSHVSANMYDVLFLGVAVLMIIGYYLYSRNRKVVNS
ncbi:MAG: hypothetical protein Q4A00_05115 [Flavobacteriaceae bacterium]|nr:hypothetical protein [Flavobacteriaceae bacterium]